MNENAASPEQRAMDRLVAAYRRQIAEARADALEEAAKTLEDKYGHLRMVDVYAATIRAMKAKP